MNDHTVRILRTDEHRTASALFRRALHAAPSADREWQRLQHAFQPERSFGVFDRELIGTARSFDSALTVPGGDSISLGAVTGVGVRSDRIRRGVLRELMGAQFADFERRGVQAALLYATEGAIYGRFGYGVGTRARSYVVDRHRARLRPEVPRGGDVELLDLDAAIRVRPQVYAGLDSTRPATIRRPSYWWAAIAVHQRREDPAPVTVLHHGPHGVDGYAAYTVARGEDATTLNVFELHAGSDAAFAGLWRYLLGVDLIDRISVRLRPLDEPVELLFTDPRACRSTEVEDEAWLRLLDVPGALAARSRAGGPLVLEVVDPLLRANSGCYLLSPDEVSRTDRRPQLRLGVDALAMVYLGTWRPSQLARAGRIDVLDPAALPVADRVFDTPVGGAAWCGTFF